jgi:hypothetical protein
MKVGDLVQYKAFPNEGCGVVMKNNAGYVLRDVYQDGK